jgi:glycosyltransferase involved in cell wall biosynthesis
MKILHCCLAAFYIDNYSYQENVLPKMHKIQGHDVRILASTETFINNSLLGYIEPATYYNTDEILVTRVPYSKLLPRFIMKKLRFYNDISLNIQEFKPDVIFLHDCQFLSIKEVVRYVKKNKNVKVFVDGHTDFINSGTNWISKNILHKIIYKKCAKMIEPFTEKFYGVLPIRVDFYRDVYKIPENKLELLVLGADHTQIEVSNRSQVRDIVIEQSKFMKDDFVIVTGGKIDERKNIHHLMEAVSLINNPKIKLIVFGSVIEEMKDKIMALTSSSSNINYVGWVSVEDSYKYLLSGDLAIFPGTHSVLWEQAVGLGIPAVFKSWNGMHHVDVGGNCLFLENVSTESIKEMIERIFNDQIFYNKMKNVAIEDGINKFSYFEIAKRAINT